MIVKLAQALARVLLVCAGLVFALALVLAVAGWRLLMWPYRSTRLGPPGALEATLGLIGAASALLASRAQQPGVEDAGVGDVTR